MVEHPPSYAGAHLIAAFLVSKGVKQVFTIPGAKIDQLHDALLETSIKIVVCRHEQNAAFMAAAYGRITGQPGVVIVTSGLVLLILLQVF